MKNLYLSLIAILFAITLISCDKTETGTNAGPNDGINPKGANILATPIITSISPTSASRNTLVTITGSNFGGAQGTNTLKFNGANVIVTSWKKTIITANIPTTTASGTVKVSVTVQRVKSNEVDLVVLQTPQVWMARNLDVTTYRNGDVIPEVTDRATWNSLTTGAWCYYNNDPAMGDIYGKLYNWYAVMDPRGLAPAGYHVPNTYDWNELRYNWGGQDLAGGLIKSTGTTYWTDPNVGATNVSGFTALPAGYRNLDGDFLWLGLRATFWAYGPSAGGPTWGDIWYLENVNTIFTFSGVNKYSGRSVRCIQD